MAAALHPRPAIDDRRRLASWRPAMVRSAACGRVATQRSTTATVAQRMATPAAVGCGLLVADSVREPHPLFFLSVLLRAVGFCFDEQRWYGGANGVGRRSFCRQ
nr:hypothetical protein Iba_chr12fCG3910 [Ipomoea batatas]